MIGIVGKDGGYTAKVAAACAIVPTVNPDHITPHSEAFQAVVWHLLVSHPKLKARADEMGVRQVSKTEPVTSQRVAGRLLVGAQDPSRASGRRFFCRSRVRAFAESTNGRSSERRFCLRSIRMMSPSSKTTCRS